MRNRILYTIIIFTVLILLLPCAGVSANPEKYQPHLAIKQIAGYTNENPQHALALIKGILNKDENPAIVTHAHIYACLSHINTGDLDSADIHIQKAQQSIDTLKIPELWQEAIKAKAYLLQNENKPREVRDLLLQSIKHTKQHEWENTHINLLLFAGEYYRRMNRIEESLKHKENALELANRLNDPVLIAECKHSIANTYWQQSDFNRALEYYHEALEARVAQADTKNQVVTLIGIATTLRDISRYNEAEEQLQRALALVQPTNDRATEAIVKNLLGSLAFRSGSHEKAIEFYLQSYTIRDSLNYMLSAASTLVNIARVQRAQGLFTESLENLGQAIDIFERIGSSKQLASSYNEMGSLYSQGGNMAEALRYYLLSLKIRQGIGVEQEIARSLINIGLTYRKIGSLNNALRYFQQALELSEAHTDPIATSYIHIHIGNASIDLGIPEVAIDSYQKALELRQRTGNQQMIAQAHRSLASAYSQMENWSKAISELEKALQLYTQTNDPSGRANIYNELGNIAQQRQQHNTALTNFARAEELYRELGNTERQGLCLRKIGEIQTLTHQFTDAYNNLNEALRLGKESGNAKLVELTLLAFHNFYIQQESYKKALDFYTMHVRVRDSLLALNQEELIWQASLDLELSKKIDEIQQIEGEVEELRTESKLKGLELDKQRVIRNFLGIITILVVLLAAGSIYGFITIRRSNKLLAEKYRIINATNSKLEESERNLKRTVKTKDKLFSIIAHDLRSPFTALTGITEVLAAKAAKMNPDEVKEYSNLIHESSSKLLNLIEVLLEWSRTQTGKLKINPQNIKISELVDETIGPLKLQAEAKGIKLINGVNQSSQAVADQDTISTVIRNLVSNAIKYSEADGTVTISTQEEADKTHIVVKDTGVGIHPDIVPKLFSLEQNVSTKGTKQETGTGLGLIVCKDFAERNGGSIRVDSALGEGSTFTVTLKRGE